jgi:uncharacterized protein (TIGR03066 family)
MRLLRFALMGALLFGFTACSKKNNTSEYPKLIVGTWKVTKGDFIGAVIEAKDNKLKVTLPADPEREQPREAKTTGTYELTGDELTLNVIDPRDGKNQKKEFKIKSLTKGELVATYLDDETKEETLVRQ